MVNNDYSSISDKELIDRVEQGECHTNPQLYAEFQQRMEKYGTTYHNTPEDVERWKADIAASVERGLERNRQRGAAIEKSKADIIASAQLGESSLNRIWGSEEENEAWRDL